MSDTIDRHLAELTELRHHLHTIAEISGEEQQTSACIRRFLENCAAGEVICGVGGHGILARFEGMKDKPRIMLRCELDALPIDDRVEGIEYLSRKEGVGHKCGHDGHMAILCGVAKALSETETERGTIYLLFQPAEETGEGAERVLNDPAFEDVDPDYCFALHNLPGFPKHRIVVRDKVFAAASVGLTVRLLGSTSHAASPEQGKSPAPAFAQLISAFSSATQFKLPIGRAGKATVVHGRFGERAFGTSPAGADLMVTLRTFNERDLEKLQDYCLKMVEGVATGRDLKYSCEFTEYFPPAVNHDKAVSAVKAAAGRSKLSLHEKKEPFGWSEDFGRFTKAYPGALFGLGAGRQHPSLHAESYDFPDEIIPSGMKMFLNIINHLK